MQKNVKEDWLKLVRASGIGPRTLIPLLMQHGSIDKLLQHASGKLAQRIYSALHHADSALLERDLAWLEQPDQHLVTWGSSQYPPQLAQISDPPIALFVKGDPDLLVWPQLAVVGSRNPSPAGRDTAFEFARHLAQTGLVITSGMASGIDTRAHQGCLQGNGQTLAVVATGCDRVYPSANRKLAEHISAQGAIVSENPPGTAPRAGLFPRRNRIISGLSLGTLVVEANIRSGSLITARLANEQGRAVMAIPGSIHNPQSRGCHRLIRQGARLVDCTADILEEVAGGIDLSQLDIPDADAPAPPAGIDDQQQALLEQMGWDPLTLEQLQSRANMDIQQLSGMLLLLELQGHVSSAPGGFYCRTVPTAAQ